MPAVSKTSQPFNIVHIEDNLAHAELVKRSFANHTYASEIVHLADGEAGLDYLFRRGLYATSTHPTPHILLLDLRLPKVDGLDVLKQIRTSDELSTLPVIILTTSAAESDAAKAYRYRANSYIVKPLDFSAFMKLIRDLGQYWLGWNYYPQTI